MTLPLLLALALGVTGTWLDLENISVEAQVPARQQPGIAVAYYLCAYESTGQARPLAPCQEMLVPLGMSATISATLAVRQPADHARLYAVVAWDTPDCPNYQAGGCSEWAEMEHIGRLFADDFESGDTSAWSRAVGEVLFRDGFESGDTDRWERSVP